MGRLPHAGGGIGLTPGVKVHSRKDTALKRLLITGAAGGLGSVARARLGHMAEILRVSDIADLGAAAAHEEIVQCDLNNGAAVMDLLEGVDGVVHFGGQPTEGPWSKVRDANINGMYHLYEACRAHGVGRVMYASSNHAIGFYPVEQQLDASVRPRPDGLYGVSKVFGEAIASLYHDKFGIETACVRIGSCFPEPVDHRMLQTWMSYDDFMRMIGCIFEVPRLGCTIIYGASDNNRRLWDNWMAGHVGWHPKDSADQFKAKLDAAMAVPGPEEAASKYHGGKFCDFPIYPEE